MDTHPSRDLLMWYIPYLSEESFYKSNTAQHDEFKNLAREDLEHESIPTFSHCFLPLQYTT